MPPLNAAGTRRASRWRAIIDASPKGAGSMNAAGQRAAGSDSPDANVVYALGSNRGESARLQQQADELASASAALLDRVGLRPGQRAVDLGCGPRGVLDLLAGRVSPGGRVVGLDADPAHTAMAAEFAAVQALGCVDIVTADARHTGLPAGSFDLVHARTLLVNVPDPAGVVAEMVRLARPGGSVAVLEPDTELGLCYPPIPAFDRLGEIFHAAFRRNGADPWIGRRVPELFRQAGLTDVGVEVRAQAFPPGHSRRTIRLDLVRSIRPQIIEMGLASGADLDELDAAARRHVQDPDTITVYGLLFLVWGRRP
jgi:ubiquinone/menaquinone biosynthesis C-methylase UbiE